MLPNIILLLKDIICELVINIHWKLNKEELDQPRQEIKSKLLKSKQNTCKKNRVYKVTE